MSKDKKRVFKDAYERAEKKSQGSARIPVKIPDGVKVYKPEEGVALLDIMPYKVGKGNPFCDEGEYHYERTYYMHRNIGPGQESFLCLAKTSNEPCPCCEERARLKKDPDADEKTVKDMGWKERQLFWVMDRRDKESGWQLFEYSQFLFGKVLDERIKADRELPKEEREGWSRFASPTNGFTLKVTWKEESIGDGTCIKAGAIDLKERKEQYSEDVCDELPCLDELLIVDEYKTIKKRLAKDGDDEDEEDEEEKPKKKKKFTDDEDEEDEKPAKKSSEDDEDEEDEKPKKKKSSDDDEEDDEKSKKGDDEDEEKPKKKKSSDEDEEDDEKPAKKKSSEDDEDEEEEKPKKKKSSEDDEDEEEEKPKKKSKGDDEDDDWDDEEPKKKKKSSDEDEE